MKIDNFNFLVGKYLNGFKIIKVGYDPFVKGQINLYTDEEIIESFGDRNLVKFFIRTENNSSKIYQELIDKKLQKYQEVNKKIRNYIENNSCGDLKITFGKELLNILNEVNDEK